MAETKKTVLIVQESGGYRKARIDPNTGLPAEQLEGKWVDSSSFPDLNDKVKASATDPTQDYLDAKVDDDTIKVESNTPKGSGKSLQ